MTKADIQIFATIAAAFFMLLGILLDRLAQSRVRKKHPTTYRELGGPTWNTAEAWWTRAYWGWLLFLLRSRFYLLQDQTLTRICKALRICHLLTTMFFLFAISLEFY